ncbi:unnamed protein product [Pleuronectes platessa]|uniref:Uncharacterized protein n=1 Tax=Pleuronectes platessa TaxID=8262 RepID=A0A9N7Z567_PLEPL|nr:unnamed protein product [Pleuronectes platessa]
MVLTEGQLAANLSTARIWEMTGKRKTQKLEPAKRPSLIQPTSPSTPPCIHPPLLKEPACEIAALPESQAEQPLSIHLPAMTRGLMCWFSTSRAQTGLGQRRRKRRPKMFAENTTNSQTEKN